jgi:hypothetical protein
VKQLQKIHSDMLAEGISFCYSGYLSEDILLGIGNTLRKKFELDLIEQKTSTSMFSVFVEMVQNVIRYSAKNQTDDRDPVTIDLRYGILAIGESGGRNFIACGNLINENDRDRLSGNLEKIQSLDQKELRRLYKETLRGDVPEGSKGAGVGFIEIARRAKHGFEFEFQPTVDEKQFFTITAYL